MERSTIVCAINLIKEVLESSSSLDDEEDEIYALLGQRNYIPRVKCFVDNVINLYSESDFKKNLRISRGSSMYFIERYSSFFSKRSYQGGRCQLPIETQILSFLWFCGNKSTFREVGNLFGMLLSTIHNSFNNVLDFIITDLAPAVIKFPQTIEEKEIMSKEFEKIAGFPNILGCIDGSYISIRTPK
ncbi:putative nuclease HARBI1, partial [Lucilia cuprina]|uniref:putative nuclease HARBI1 n=1 Tax=Lucilia cuprina TaxID=7375 RepID=UPI001F059770